MVIVIIVVNNITILNSIFSHKTHNTAKSPQPVYSVTVCGVWWHTAHSATYPGRLTIYTAHTLKIHWVWSWDMKIMT